MQRIFDGILFGKKRKKHEVYGLSAFTEYSRGLTLPPTLLIGCERDVYVRHSLLLSRLFEDMVKEGRCPRFVFDYVPAAEETRKLRHVYNIVHYEWRESMRVNDLSLEFFCESMKADCAE